MKNVTFRNDDLDLAFMQTLKQRVNGYFQDNKIAKVANRTAWVKGSLLATSYTFAYVNILLSTSVGEMYCWFMLSGVLTIFVALNIAHDAAHGTFSSKTRVNNLLLYTFDILGASGYMWRLKHVHSHHPHVNIPNMDGDIKQSNLVRIFPNVAFLRFHRFQFLYMPFLYMFYTLFWLMIRDFKDYFDTDISGKPGLKHPMKEYIKLFFWKSVFVSRMLVLPYLVIGCSVGQVVLGFVLFHICASYTVALALISAHVGEHSVYPEPDKNGKMKHSWVRHQIITTCDFATDNWLITQLFGGFNHHIVHHLFPNICHIHYPVLTKILVETCHEYQMPYNTNPRLIDAIVSHLRFLRMRSVQNVAIPYIEM